MKRKLIAYSCVAISSILIITSIILFSVRPSRAVNFFTPLDQLRYSDLSNRVITHHVGVDSTIYLDPGYIFFVEVWGGHGGIGALPHIGGDTLFPPRASGSPGNRAFGWIDTRENTSAMQITVGIGRQSVTAGRGQRGLGGASIISPGADGGPTRHVSLGIAGTNTSGGGGGGGGASGIIIDGQTVLIAGGGGGGGGSGIGVRNLGVNQMGLDPLRIGGAGGRLGESAAPGTHVSGAITGGGGATASAHGSAGTSNVGVTGASTAGSAAGGGMPAMSQSGTAWANFGGGGGGGGGGATPGLSGGGGGVGGQHVGGAGGGGGLAGTNYFGSMGSLSDRQAGEQNGVTTGSRAQITRYTPPARPAPIDAPEIRSENGFLVWDRIENATGYQVILYGNSPTIIGSIDDPTVTQFDVLGLNLGDGAHAFRVRAIGDGNIFLDSELSNTIHISIGIPDPPEIGPPQEPPDYGQDSPTRYRRSALPWILLALGILFAIGAIVLFLLPRFARRS